MGGTIVIIVILVLIVPVSIIMTGLVASGLLGAAVKKDVDHDKAGTELFVLSRRTFTPDEEA